MALSIDGKPLRVRIGGNLAREAGGYAVAGLHLPGDIRIAGGMTRRSQQISLAHELLHECWARSKPSLRGISVKDEEYIVDNLAPWLLAALQQNPELTEFLTQSPDDG